LPPFGTAQSESKTATGSAVLLCFPVTDKRKPGLPLLAAIELFLPDTGEPPPRH
jgi:hypothetical protein